MCEWVDIYKWLKERDTCEMAHEDRPQDSFDAGKYFSSLTDKSG